MYVQGYVRFDEDQGAKKAMEGMTADGAKPEICGKETELRVLEGESGSQYYLIPRLLSAYYKKKLICIATFVWGFG